MRVGTVLAILAFVVAELPFGAADAAHVHPAARVLRVAPADEYFGRLKMSILGIRNQLRDLNLRLQYSPGDGDAVVGAAAMVEDAMRDWERKYPGDPWLAKSVYQLTAIYARVRSNAGRRCAARAFAWLVARYGKSGYARKARTELADTLK